MTPFFDMTPVLIEGVVVEVSREAVAIQIEVDGVCWWLRPCSGVTTNDNMKIRQAVAGDRIRVVIRAYIARFAGWRHRVVGAP